MSWGEEYMCSWLGESRTWGTKSYMSFGYALIVNENGPVVLGGDDDYADGKCKTPPSL